MFTLKIQVLSVREPQWANEEGTSINCIASFGHLKGEHPFTASLSDPEPHGREIFARCLLGEFGSISKPEKMASAPLSGKAAQRTPAQEEFEAFLGYVNLENSRRSPRSVVVIWGAFLDQLLGELIEKSSQELPKRPKNKGHLTFSTRIQTAKELGLIDQSDHDKFQIIRNIRNTAAHEWNLTLESPKVLSSLKELYTLGHSDLFVFLEDFGFLIQQIYAGSCALLATKMLASIDAHRGPNLTAS